MRLMVVACVQGEIIDSAGMKSDVGHTWTADEILALMRGYQGAAVLAAGAELNVFGALAAAPSTAAELAQATHCDPRGLVMLLDALAAMGLLGKSENAYSLPPGLDAFLTADGAQSVLAMLQHQANCLRNWSQLARVVQNGRPAPKFPSVRGEAGDQESFIGAMHNVSLPNADEVIQAVQPLQFGHLLDVGGASGTWTIAFLRACPQAQATLFDLPQVIPLARQRLAGAGVGQRVRLAPGNFMADPLPGGADLAWISAIVHQNSREQNRTLFAKVFEALVPGGRLAIRDILMDESRTQPVMGALFAINMLVATEGGGTFTVGELRQDLESAGFAEVTVTRLEEDMNSVLVARKPK
jgi:ubiquinone/menaquinone biosynthesis C-methylase UbiE